MYKAFQHVVCNLFIQIIFHQHYTKVCTIPLSMNGVLPDVSPFAAVSEVSVASVDASKFARVSNSVSEVVDS